MFAIRINLKGREMDSTLKESREMRAEDGRWPRKNFDQNSNRQRLQKGGLGCLGPRRDCGSIRQYDLYHRVMGFVGRPSGNRLVEGVNTDAPGCRTKTGYARRFSCKLTADPGSIPGASTIIANNSVRVDE